MALTTNDIVRILQLKGLGRRTAKKLCELDFQGTGSDLIDFIIKVGREKVIQRFPNFSRLEITEAFKKGDIIIEKSSKAGIQIIDFFNKRFPRSLKCITDPPLVINVKGNVEALTEATCIAIIGTRQPSIAGTKAGEHFGKQLGLMGFNIISGLAIGCDSSAHKGCLSVGGITTAILAHGLHTVYPKENFLLSEEILKNGGVLLSEYFIGTGAKANFFVERDRLQAGLSEATIVIQTDERGGTMYAVNATLAQGKKLAAVKYKDSDLAYPKTRGNMKLINEGRAFALSSENLQDFISTIGNKYKGLNSKFSTETGEDQSHFNSKELSKEISEVEDDTMKVKPLYNLQEKERIKTKKIKKKSKTGGKSSKKMTQNAIQSQTSLF